jgi:hypothetical protein
MENSLSMKKLQNLCKIFKTSRTKFKKSTHTTFIAKNGVYPVEGDVKAELPAFMGMIFLIFPCSFHPGKEPFLVSICYCGARPIVGPPDTAHDTINS